MPHNIQSTTIFPAPYGDLGPFLPINCILAVSSTAFMFSGHKRAFPIQGNDCLKMPKFTQKQKMHKMKPVHFGHLKNALLQEVRVRFWHLSVSKLMNACASK